jgi:hypothetical protein
VAKKKTKREGDAVKVSDIVFREDLYPRIEKSPTTVQKYAEDLSVLPPIEVNQHSELIDGWHRWTGHKKKEVEEIAVVVTETTSDAHLLELAIERNAAHGLQLSQEDKRNMARTIYHVVPTQERDEKKKHLAKILCVSERTIREWLSRIDKDTKEARSKRILELWMACHTQQEIAELVALDKANVNRELDVCCDVANVPERNKPAANHQAEFEPPVYNIWKQQEKTAGSSHFGNSEVRWLDNLLYLYTDPFDVVVDPFAGGGSTIDLCKKRWRRYWASDRKPIVEREDIREHDIIDGLPKLHRWADVGLVYLDPPYWKQAENKYSEDPEDLANMELEEFNKTLSKLIKDFAKKLKDAYVALIIQPTQWKAPERQFTDHVGDMLRMVKLPVEMRFSAPYESQQMNAQMVEWAKAEKRCLVLTREIVVWRVD